VKKDRPPLPFLPVLAEDLADGPYPPRRELSYTVPRSQSPTPATQNRVARAA
jgi:hypothetical protein